MTVIYIFRCIISLRAVIGAGIYFCVSKANCIFFGMALLLDMNFLRCVCCKLFSLDRICFLGFTVSPSVLSLGSWVD